MTWLLQRVRLRSRLAQVSDLERPDRSERSLELQLYWTGRDHLFSNEHVRFLTAKGSSRRRSRLEARRDIHRHSYRGVATQHR